MRVSEMRAREDYDRILRDTLTRGWSLQFGERVTVSAVSAGTAGQAWRHHELLGAYCVARPSVQVRRFLRDWFRHTRVKGRALAQWLVGTAMASGLGLALVWGKGFRTSPALPDARRRLVLPGNQRIRVFDFGAGTVRAMLKVGSADGAIRNELAIRGAKAKGPFPPITAGDASAGWFEEPIIEGYALPRVPPRFDEERLAERAAVALDEWSGLTVRSVDAGDHAESLRGEIRGALDATPEGGDAWREVVTGAAWLADVASKAGTVELARVHGDFQPGNVLVSPNGQDVTIVDWEHSAIRFRPYDRFVFGLASRTGGRISARLEAFVGGHGPSTLKGFPRDRSYRSAAAAMFVLEDLLWFARESAAGPYRRASGGLFNYRNELASIMSGLRAYVEPGG
jgi:hypothetical protein